MRAAATLFCAGLVGCLPTGVGASPFAAFQPPALLVAMSAVDAATCRIETERRSGLVHVSGVVRASEDVVATATLHVRRTGRAGRSDNAQGGLFAVRAGEEATVGRVALSAHPTDDLSAELTVEWDGGRAACSYP